MLQQIADLIQEYGSLVLFAGFALLTLGSAVLVVTARRVTHACLSLLPCFIGIAGLYALLASPVMLAFQLLIYAGGIMVLLLFAIFLLERRAGPITAANHYVLPAGLIAGLTAITILGALRTESFANRDLRPPPLEMRDASGVDQWYAWDPNPEPGQTGERPSSNIKRTGFYFMTYYLLPFELTSLILVIAMVGAIMIARREKGWVAAGRIPERQGTGDRGQGTGTATADGGQGTGTTDGIAAEAAPTTADGEGGTDR
jgi:NADH:ubiquinone oxidoreductase subunit 6 (subunit J)